MSYRSWLMGRARPGQRDALVRAFVARGVIEECRATIPGFLAGQLLTCDDDADALCVTVEWADRQAFLDWQASPVRAAQAPALAQWLDGSPQSRLFHCVHSVGDVPASAMKPDPGKPCRT